MHLDRFSRKLADAEDLPERALDAIAGVVAHWIDDLIADLRTARKPAEGPDSHYALVELDVVLQRLPAEVQRLGRELRDAVSAVDLQQTPRQLPLKGAVSPVLLLAAALETRRTPPEEAAPHTGTL